MKQFKSVVPANIIAKLTSLSQAIDISELMGRSIEAYSEQNIGDIEGNYVSGWLPSQDGGVSADQLYDNGVDCFHTIKQKDYNAEQYKDCEKQFANDVLGEGKEWDDYTEEEKEQFYGYEREWFDPSLVQVQMFVEGYYEGSFGPKEKTVTVRLSVNYKDAPYYREKYAEDINVLIMEIDEFLSMDNEAIIAQLKERK